MKGQTVLRLPARPRHELILTRLHQRLAGSLTDLVTTRLLARRTRIELNPQNLFRPDVALITTASNKLWLVGEVISSDDHHADTVDKKEVYEELKLPRLWVVDPRYDNVEVYHGTPYGLTLKKVLAGRDVLTEPLLTGFQFAVHELFAGDPGGEKSAIDF